MSDLARHLEDYLSVRRALGFKLRRQGEVLPKLVAYLDAAGVAALTTELAVAWARLPEGVHPINWSHRLGAARGFAAYLKTIDPRTEVPPCDVFPRSARRPTPYLWSEGDVHRLLEATRQIRPPLRAATHEALFGLLAVSGLRMGEALHLQRDDFNLAEGLLTIREAKFGRSRLVPLHPSATDALRSYAAYRDRLCPTPRSKTFFISSVGTALLASTVRETFIHLTTVIGLRTAVVRPRIHDLRHSLAVHALVEWHRSGASVEGRMVVLSTYLGHVNPASTYWYLSASPELMELAAARLDGRFGSSEMSALAPTLESFFTDRLMNQRQASPHTIAAYRDTFQLLLRYAAERTRKQPCELDIGDLDAPLVAAFLEHLEHDRHNGVRTRNNRLAAIHSLFGYTALRHPEHAGSIQRVLAIPAKRFERNLVTYLTDEEVDALIVACDRATWTGRRDHAMLVLAIQTGLRISELAGITCADIVFGSGPNVHCVGKGRKERRTPLGPLTIGVLRVWLAERKGSPSEPLFPTITGSSLSRDAIEHRIAHYASIAGKRWPSMRTKHVTAHTLRHTCAMRLLSSGVDVTMIALWLGHEQVSTTNIYLHADMTRKELAIARTNPPTTSPGRYRAPDRVLAFLEAL